MKELVKLCGKNGRNPEVSEWRKHMILNQRDAKVQLGRRLAITSFNVMEGWTREWMKNGRMTIDSGTFEVIICKKPWTTALLNLVNFMLCA